VYKSEKNIKNQNFIHLSGYLLLLSMIVFFSCKRSAVTSNDSDDVILAEVGPYNLRLSDISDIVPKDASPEDSIVFINAMVNNWVKDQLLVLEAEINQPQDLDIEQLVNDYRASLLVYHYETQLMNQFLDTLVTIGQKKAYYQENKEQYLLPDGLIKYRMLKVTSKAPNQSAFFQKWKSADEAAIIAYMRNNFGKMTDYRPEWKTLSEFLSSIPEGKVNISKLNAPAHYQINDQEHVYFIEVSEYINENEVPPFEYIESKITKVILNNRKKELLDSKKQQIFAREIGGRKIKIHTNP
jgi:hypothetical protein